jgi:hypothetical protein
MFGIVLMGALVATVACSDSTGVDGTAPVEVSLRMDGSALSAAAFGGALSSGSAMEGVTPNQVDSLFVLVTSVSFLPVEAEGEGEGEEEEAEWIFLTLDEPIQIDLMSLPTEEDSLFVTGELPVGDYGKIRLQVSDASVWFNETIAQGPATLDPDIEHPVTVPSGSTSGIKTDLSFTVADDGNGTPAAVSLAFDPALTFSNLHVTGSGKVTLSPVFKTP